MKNLDNKNVALYATGGNNIQISKFSVFTPFAIGLITLPLLGFSILIGLIRIPYLIIKGESIKSSISTALSFFTGILFFSWLIVWAILGEPFVGLVPLNFWSYLFYMIPIALTLLVLIGFGHSVWIFNSSMSRILKIHALLTFAFTGIVMGYLIYWDVVGFKPWSY